MDANKTKNFKEKLTKELAVLETELKTVGARNPSNPADWVAKIDDSEFDHADRNEVADEIGNLETNIAILKDLEIRYNEVKNALEKIEKGEYGVCVVCGKEIEEERLEANQAAATCKEHINVK